jgi:hypothetical protein
MMKVLQEQFTQIPVIITFENWTSRLFSKTKIKYGDFTIWFVLVWKYSRTLMEENNLRRQTAVVNFSVYRELSRWGIMLLHDE